MTYSAYNSRKDGKLRQLWLFIRKTFFSERLLLAYFYLLVMIIGAIFLKFPFSIQENYHLRTLDAFFMATSAITVTGLMPVSMDTFTDFGLFVILILIQVGGLGFITFTTLLLLVPGGQISIKNARIVRNFFLSSVEYNPRRIMRDVLLLTFTAELIGAILIWLAFWWQDLPMSFYSAIFHAISAFCNAGIAISDHSVQLWKGVPWALIVLSILTIFGGIGFVSLSDIFRRISPRYRSHYRLTLHTKIVLLTSLALLVTGTIFFFVGAMVSGGNSNVWHENLLIAYFHSAMTRTGGFSYTLLEAMPFASQILTLPLMFIGAGPGSMSGGIKVTTFFLILIVIFRDDFRYNSFKLGNHQISIDSFRRAMIFFIRALMLLILFIGLVFIAEQRANNSHLLFSLVFETVSAFSTVGLSMGVTPFLSDGGKLVIMLAMLSGRVGLFSLAIYVPNPQKERGYQLPEQEVLLG